MQPTPKLRLRHGVIVLLALALTLPIWTPRTPARPVIAQSTDPPGTLALTRPANGAAVTDLTPSFTWTRFDGAVSYAFELAADAAFAGVLMRQETTRRSYTTPEPLNEGRTYYWHVGAIDPVAQIAWSDTWSFSTPAKPTPTSTKTSRPTSTPRGSTPTSTPRPTRTPTPQPKPASALSGTLAVTKGAKILAGGRSRGSDSPSNVVDRKLGTIWLSAGGKPSAGYVYFKLDRPQQITRVRWLFGVNGYADAMSIEVSVDKSVWTPVGTAGNAPAGSWRELKLAVPGMYVRFRFANPNGDLFIGGPAEVEIYASALPPPTATATRTATPTRTPTSTRTSTATTSPSPTPTATLILTATPTASATPTPAETSTPTNVPTATPTASATPEATATQTSTATPTATATATATNMLTPSPAATQQPPISGELLLNRGFEAGAANWDLEGTSSVTATGAHAGSNALRLVEGGAFADPSLRVQQDETYALTAWGKLDGDIDLGLVGLIYRDANGTRLRDLEPADLQFIQTSYAQKRLVFTIPQGVASVTVLVWKNAGPAAFLVDDLSLVQLPGPEPPAVPALTCQQLMAPAYFYPTTGRWGPLIDQGSALDIIIFNPNSGVGEKRDWRYDVPLTNARAQGIELIGYIQTDYSERSVAAVIAEMEQFREWYGVTSFFLDEASTGWASIPLYREMTDHVHTMGGIAVLNFGYHPHPGYMAIADVVVTFEDAANVYADHVTPAWVHEFPANRFMQMIYGVSADQIDTVLAKTRESNAGLLWLTDDHISTGSPYNTLPTYWSSLNTRLTTDCGE